MLTEGLKGWLRSTPIPGRGDNCAASVSRGPEDAIERLPEGDATALRWRTSTAGGLWGEYTLIALDDTRLLAVGFETTADEAPVELDELVDLAEAGARQFPDGQM